MFPCLRQVRIACSRLLEIQNKIPCKFGFTKSTHLSRPAVARGGISAWAPPIRASQSGKVAPGVVRPQISAAFVRNSSAVRLVSCPSAFQGMGRRGLLTAALLLCFLAVCSGRGENSYSLLLCLLVPQCSIAIRDVRRLHLGVLVVCRFAMRMGVVSVKKKKKSYAKNR